MLSLLATTLLLGAEIAPQQAGAPTATEMPAAPQAEVAPPLAAEIAAAPQEAPPGPPLQAYTPGEKHSTFSVAPLATYLHMKVDGISPAFHGVLIGGQAAYEYRGDNGFYARAQGSMAVGRVKNHGNNPNRYIHDEEIEGRLGYVWNLGDFAIIPSVGYGFRYFIEYRYHASGLDHLKFQYQKYYVPVSLEIDYWWGKNWELSFIAAWLPDIDPTLKIPQANCGRWGLAHKQGFRADLPIRYFYHDFSFGLIPTWEWYQIGGNHDTDAVGLGTAIHAQNLIYWGGQIEFAYRF